MKRWKKYFGLWLLCSVMAACAVRHPGEWNESDLPEAPDYADAASWVALPDREDPCDRLPKGYEDSYPTPPVQPDIFFVYPTILNNSKEWNADIQDRKLNRKIRRTTIRHQAGVFSGIGRIYSPYYRQMNLYGYYGGDGSQAFEVAYADIKAAFLYYIEHHNAGKPFIIASHSQGTQHAARLIREVVMPDARMRYQLLLAYLIGMPIPKDLGGLPPCNSPDDLYCFLSWRTYGKQFVPPVHGDSIFSINPVTFDTNKPQNEASDHLGIVRKSYKLKNAASITAVDTLGFVRVKEIDAPFRKLMEWNNYHVADYNLFWANIRENLMRRLARMQR